MNKPNPVVRYLPGLLICLAALAAAPSGPAQTLGSAEKDKVGEPAKAAAAGTDNDTEIVLSPFLVSTTKDTGYTATNSQAGTKMNTNVKDLPFSVDVLTADFIHDIGAQRVLDALAYTTSVNVTSTNESDPLISVRGLPASVLRDGLTTFIQPDLAMVDRIEGDRLAGVDVACELVETIRESGAFDGVHLIPVSRYREVAARLESAR